MKKGEKIKIYDNEDNVIDAVYCFKTRYCHKVLIKNPISGNFNHDWFINSSRIKTAGV